ncbi:IscS subfamily cysteine desulfurase [Arcticibacter tournemirensis]|uniref:Cysteine desulfurase IscS n=1 Tax=Arcticibacter tournemirensis TaxID=699437 RepID=A0A4V1KHJ5_9SPHI|nr:IscS subfamily cysteine desulfurase [Arcticibacter tournemirensis]RXF67412.1 IscS subfamily cysteine desulfurase [Arcticibacter tournemirensis]
MLTLPVYLDHNATTPMDPLVLEAMIPYFTKKFGNPASRNHAFGWIAEEAVDLAREQVSKLIGASDKEIIFTSGATEADNLAIKGVFEMYREKGNHIVTYVTEHKAVIDTCKHLEKLGAEITYLAVNSDGLIDLKELESVLNERTILVSIMYANNETGVIQPIREISELVHRHGSLLFTDATQAVGKIPVDVNEDGIDLMAFSAHKMYGPKGVGGLYVRRKNPRVRITAQIDGGGHERGLRSGTLNVPGIVGLGKACELCRTGMEEEVRRLSYLRDKLENSLLELEETCLNGNKEQRLPGITNISFSHAESDGLIMAMKDIAVSSGSACTSASIEPSHVLKGMGLSDSLAHSSIRFGLGRFTNEEEIDFVIEQTQKAVKQLREGSPFWKLFKEAGKAEWQEN